MTAGMSVGDIVRSARRAKQQTGRSIAGQLVDILRLRLLGHGIMPDIYYDMRLFEPGLSWRQKAEYVGSWIKPLVYRVQDPKAVALFSDKLRALAFFREHAIASPEILAATHPDIDIPGVVALRSPAELKTWLLDRAPFPLFSKPSVSYRGYGNTLITSITRDTGEILYGDGRTETIDSFAEKHGAPGKPTLIFQNVIAPHPLIAATIGQRLATARVMVLNDRPEPEIFRAGLRIPAGASMVDNFRGGASGNMLARLDIATGAVVDVLSAIGLDWRAADHHPDTGAPFAGLAMPDWQQAIDLVLRASRLVPGLKIHNWDVAFTDTGPMLIEDNPNGDLVLVQTVANRGLATPRFLELYENRRIR
jgi:hypothetical protein